MNGVADEGIDRLHELLTAALERTRPAPYDAPVTVAEIYQELVPYRAIRSELGFGLNAEYEHALLRLLSGEAGLLRLEPEEARESIERELRTLSPNVSIYRDYAGCDVWVRPRASQSGTKSHEVEPEHKAESREAPVPTPAPATAGSPSAAGRGSATHARPGEPDPGPGMAAHASAPVSSPASAAALEERPAPAAAGRAATAAAAARESGVADPAVRSRRCGYCDSELPLHRTVQYCPWCGGDQAPQPCGACAEPIEPGWAYCVACGAGRSGPAEG